MANRAVPSIMAAEPPAYFGSHSRWQSHSRTQSGSCPHDDAFSCNTRSSCSEESASILAVTNYSTKDVNQRNENMTSCSIFRRAAAIRSGLLPTQDKSSGAAIL